MIHARGHVATPEASRWLQRLCHHFSRKIVVQYDAHQGRAEFPWGVCEMRADAQALHFACTAQTGEALAQGRFTIEEHVKLFARRVPMVVQWDFG